MRDSGDQLDSLYRPATCAEARELFDSFLDHELALNDVTLVLHHARRCRACLESLDERSRIKRMVQDSVRTVMAPEGLLRSVRARIRI